MMREDYKTLPIDKARNARLNPEKILSPFFEGDFKPRYGSSFSETKNKIDISGTVHKEDAQYPAEVNITFPGFFKRTIAKIRRKEPVADVSISVGGNN